MAERFIKTVQEQIEWKRARQPATLEIREYMLDRMEQLMTESGIFEIADEARPSEIAATVDEAKMSEIASMAGKANMPENTSVAGKANVPENASVAGKAKASLPDTSMMADIRPEQKLQTITERVVEEMGNPIEIGKSLNELHHPRFDAKLFMSMLGMMILGVIFNICCGTSRSAANTIFINTMGIGVVVASYFFDYTIVIRKISAFVTGGMILLAITFWLDTRTGVGAKAYAYSLFAGILCMALMAVKIRMDKNVKAYIVSLTLSTVILYVMMVLQSIPGIILVTGAVIINTIYICRKVKSKKQKSAVSLAQVLAFVTGFLFFDGKNLVQRVFNIEGIAYVRNVISASSFIGISQSGGIGLEKTDYQLDYFIAGYGLVAAVFLLIIYIIIMCNLQRLMKKQSLDVNRGVLSYIVLVFGVQIAGAYINAFGLAYVGGMDLPFVSNGICFAFCDYLLFGLVMSMRRHEDIVVDLLRV